MVYLRSVKSAAFAYLRLTATRSMSKMVDTTATATSSSTTNHVASNVANQSKPASPLPAVNDPDMPDDGGGEWLESTTDRRKKQKQKIRNQPLSPSSPPLFDIGYIEPTEESVMFQPFMLLLCGMPGSGKSTFARALEQAMPYKFVRINQDELSSRKACISMCRKVIRERKCPIIDRCNFDPEQRSTWNELAREKVSPSAVPKRLPQSKDLSDELRLLTLQNRKLEDPLPVHMIIFDVSKQECIQRCKARKDHETVAPDQAREVVTRMSSKMDTAFLNKEAYEQVILLQTSAQFKDTVLQFLNQKK